MKTHQITEYQGQLAYRCNKFGTMGRKYGENIWKWQGETECFHCKTRLNLSLVNPALYEPYKESGSIKQFQDRMNQEVRF